LTSTALHSIRPSKFYPTKFILETAKISAWHRIERNTETEHNQPVTRKHIKCSSDKTPR